MNELRITDCPTNDICELYLKLAEQIEAYKQADHEATEIIAELKHENEKLKKVNEQKNELLAKLGCPTTATAKRKVFVLEEQIKGLKQALIDIKEWLLNYQYDANILKHTQEPLKTIGEVLNESNI